MLGAGLEEGVDHEAMVGVIWGDDRTVLCVVLLVSQCYVFVEMPEVYPK